MTSLMWHVRLILSESESRWLTLSMGYLKGRAGVSIYRHPAQNRQVYLVDNQPLQANFEVL